MAESETQRIELISEGETQRIELIGEGETRRIELISGIDDIGEMFEAMEALDISSKGCQTLQDMKDRVITTTNQSSKSISWSAGQVRLIVIKRRDEQIMLFFIYSVLLIALLSYRLLVRCYF